MRKWLARLLMDGPKESTPEEPSYRCDKCTMCGGEWFVPGGQVTRVESNGERSRPTLDGSLITCLTCGTRWASTPAGLLKPHSAALPLSWAAYDEEQKVRRAQIEAMQARKDAIENGKAHPAAARRSPADGFRLPPKPTRT